MQAYLANKMQKSCGEGQGLSNTASENFLKTGSFPEISLRCQHFFIALKKKKKKGVKIGEKFN